MRTIENCDVRIENCGFEISDLKSHGGGARSTGFSRTARRMAFSHCIPPKGGTTSARRGFTLVELLVVITIIAMLAGMALGALAKTRERAKLDATKETVAKINDLVMRRYESYRTRRVPLNFMGSGLTPKQIAVERKNAIRDLMRLEMPSCASDITTAPYKSSTGQSLSSSLWNRYNSKNNAATKKLANVSDHASAKCLYLWITTTFPEAKALFRGEEIADVDKDGWKCFVDGWGHPIAFSLWAPGATGWSDIQVDDTNGANLHHDPFDPLNTDKNAYQLYPLVYAGVLGKDSSNHDDYGINQTTKTGSSPLNPYASPYDVVGAISTNGGIPLVTNHHIEAR